MIAVETNPFFIAAMAYAKRGWAVLPLTPRAKPPLGKLVPHGWKDAATDEDTIARWWQGYPNANIGIRTGVVSGLVVLDIDPRNDGVENLRKLEQQNGELPTTVMSLTGGGGMHILFQHPGGFIKNKTLAPGVEVKADGGYVVAPPSIHPNGEAYCWEASSYPDDVLLAPLPEWLLQHMTQDTSRHDQPSGSSGGSIPEGERHNRLVSFAGTMRWKDMSQKAIAEALLIENRLRCIPPLPEHEVMQIAQSMNLYAPALRINGATGSDKWPRPLAKDAYHGLLGEFVATIEPHTEADSAAILLQILVAYGNVLNRRPHFRVEADIHALNLYVVLVGQTAKGRKGTSWGRVRQLFKMADPDWSSQRIHSGLSSGEGLIWHVRDPIYKEEPVREKKEVVGYQSVRVDPGIEDKRLLILESELALVLRTLQRDGNTLSAVVRQAWDHGDLRVLTKNNPVTATGAHISIIGHITQDELCRYLDDTETANGFANRFLWICVRRSKCLPEGGSLHEEDLEPLVHRLKGAIYFGRSTGQISLDEEARKLWHELYPKLSTGRPGLLGNVTSRADPLVIRLSCLYALLDQSAHIRLEHLKAGAEVWRYSLDSARYIFGSALGDHVADRILDALRQHPEGMTRTAINTLLGNNQRGSDIERALDVLVNAGLARKEEETTGGRPATRWYATHTIETI